MVFLDLFRTTLVSADYDRLTTISDTCVRVQEHIVVEHNCGQRALAPMNTVACVDCRTIAQATASNHLFGNDPWPVGRKITVAPKRGRRLFSSQGSIWACACIIINL